MLIVAIDIISFLIVVAWCLILLLVLAFVVAALVEFGRALASVIAGAARHLGRGGGGVALASRDERFLRHIGIRR